MSKRDIKGEVVDLKEDEMTADSMEENEKQLMCVEREFLGESTSRISWLHSKKSFTNYAEITLSYAYLHELVSPDLGKLCESFKNL